MDSEGITALAVATTVIVLGWVTVMLAIIHITTRDGDISQLSSQYTSSFTDGSDGPTSQGFISRTTDSRTGLLESHTVNRNRSPQCNCYSDQSSDESTG